MCPKWVVLNINIVLKDLELCCEDSGNDIVTLSVRMLPACRFTTSISNVVTFILHRFLCFRTVLIWRITDTGKNAVCSNKPKL